VPAHLGKSDSPRPARLGGASVTPRRGGADHAGDVVIEEGSTLLQQRQVAVRELIDEAARVLDEATFITFVSWLAAVVAAESARVNLWRLGRERVRWGNE
jgi:hypothetical protein